MTFRRRTWCGIAAFASSVCGIYSRIGTTAAWVTTMGQDWLRNHVRWGPNANIVDQLSEDTLERIIDIMEKRTAMGSIATMVRA